MKNKIEKGDIGRWCLIKGLTHVKGEPFLDQYFFRIIGVSKNKYLIIFPSTSEHIFEISPSKIEISKLHYAK